MNVLSCGLLWAKSIKHFGDYGRHYPRDIRKNPRSMCARVPQAMAQFVLKIEKLSHITGTAPTVELARAYGLHPRLWLLEYANYATLRCTSRHVLTTYATGKRGTFG